MLLRLTHRTEYVYPGPSRNSHNEVRLKPLNDEFQRCLQFDLTTTPRAAVNSYEEPGGTVHHFGVRQPHERLVILVDAIVETFLANPFDGLDTCDRNWSFYENPKTMAAFTEYLVPSPYVWNHPTTQELAERIRKDSDGTVLGFLGDLSAAIHDHMDYDPDATHVHTTIEEIVSLKAGVCQDFAHLMLACVRSQGIPARYVSGYLYGGESSVRGDQASHAWLECLLPEGKWVALDPTNNLFANDRYIRVHTGRDYSEVAPTRGIYMGFAASSLEVEVRVRRLAPAIA